MEVSKLTWLEQRLEELYLYVHNSDCPKCGHFKHAAGECSWHKGECDEAEWCKCDFDAYIHLKDKILRVWNDYIR